MRRSRRLSGLQPDLVPDVLKPAPKRAPAKKKKPTTSSSKKENKPPSRSARKTQQKITRTKHAASTRTSSQKRTTPKKSTTPKRGRAKPRVAAASARSRSGRSGTSTKSQKKTTQRSRSAKRTKTPKQKSAKKGSTSIHPKTPKQTPVAPPRDDAEEEKNQDNDEREMKYDNLLLPDVQDDDFISTAQVPTKLNWPNDTVVESKEPEPAPQANGHSLDMTMVGIVVCLISLYLISFCRSMSCSALPKLPWLSPPMMEFNMGAIAVTSLVVYIVSLAYCRKWMQTDRFMVPDEGAFITLHSVHGLLIILHLVSCAVMDPDKKDTNCTESIVALSMGFYAAAWAMQLKFSVQFLRNSITLAYVCGFYYNGKNAFGYVLMLAAKSVFWMTGAHMMEIVNDERWSMIDIMVTIGCGFLAFLVPDRL